LSEVKSAEWLLLDHHGVFVVYQGAGIVAESSWDFSLVDIKKAILKMRLENAPWGGGGGFAIQYFDPKNLTWNNMGKIDVWWRGGGDYKEVDVTDICKRFPSTKWRAQVNIFIPWVFFYACMHSRALLYLEYTGEGANPGGVQSTTPVGSQEQIMMAQMMDFMMQFMMMFMMVSLMTSIIGMVGG
jgi:hypothetical protein